MLYACSSSGISQGPKVFSFHTVLKKAVLRKVKLHSQRVYNIEGVDKPICVVYNECERNVCGFQKEEFCM